MPEIDMSTAPRLTYKGKHTDAHYSTEVHYSNSTILTVALLMCTAHSPAVFLSVPTVLSSLTTVETCTNKKTRMRETDFNRLC